MAVAVGVGMEVEVEVEEGSATLTAACLGCGVDGAASGGVRGFGLSPASSVALLALPERRLLRRDP